MHKIITTNFLPKCTLYCNINCCALHSILAMHNFAVIFPSLSDKLIHYNGFFQHGNLFKKVYPTMESTFHLNQENMDRFFLQVL